MSSEEVKVQHSKRRAKTASKIKKQVKIARAAGMDVSEEHRFAKKHAMDCGIPKCPVCHPNPKRERTIQELKFMDTQNL